MANIHSNINVLLFENTQSFLAGAILHRMAGNAENTTRSKIFGIEIFHLLNITKTRHVTSHCIILNQKALLMILGLFIWEKIIMVISEKSFRKVYKRDLVTLRS